MKSKFPPLAYAMAVVLLAACLAVTPGFGQSANDGFDPNVNGRVQAVALQPDGKIIVGGEFTGVGGIARSNIARVNVDGTLDATFNPGTDIDCVGCYQSVSALAVQADGKILVGGRFTVLGGMARTNIGRLNTNGSIDTSFQSTVDGQVLELAVVAGGKVLVAGAFFKLNGQPRMGIGRLNADGSLDTNFNAGANETVNSLVVQPDGRILVGGDFTMLGGQTRIGIGRLNADGSLDASFNPGAITEEMETVALQADGKVLVGGDFTMIGNVPRAGIGRLNADGSVDSGFDPGMEGGGLHTLVVQPDGKILVGGFFTTLSGQARTNIGRLNPDGSLDATFHPEIDSAVNRFVVQPDGSILVGGWFTMLGGTNRNHLGRLYPDGKVEKTFFALVGGTMGLSLIDVAIPLNDGKVIAGGLFFSGDPNLRRTNLVRFLADGKVDETFNASLSYGNDPVVFPHPVDTVALLPDGRLLVRDYLHENGSAIPRLSRLNSAGSVDPAFSTEATVGINRWALQPDGRILISTIVTNDAGLRRVNIGRLLPGGATISSSLAQANSNITALMIQADGRILIGGRFTEVNGRPRLRLARLHMDGALDESFVASAGDEVTVLAMQADGKVLVGGDFESINGQFKPRLARLNADGTLDRNFGLDFPMYGSPVIVDTLAVMADGRILVGGSFTAWPPATTNLIRLHPNGSLDTSFNARTAGLVQSLSVQADGKTLAGGILNQFGGFQSFAFGRLTSDAPAIQRLEMDSAGSTVTWIRGGSVPEVEHAAFELSPDGTNFTMLGGATRISGGWRLNELALPAGEGFYVRARGRFTAGIYNGSSGIMETVAQFWRLPPPFMSSVQVLGGGVFQFSFTNTNAAVVSVLASSDVAAAPANWENLGAPVPVGNGLYQFTDPGVTSHPRRFYQLRSP